MIRGLRKMTRRQRQLIILGLSIIAFVGMVLLITGGISSRRRNRDLKFGLEQLDILIADGEFDEAAGMIPWLAGRADDGIEMLSVLKRGVNLLDSTGDPEPLDLAARSGVDAFPGNTAIRSIGVYAAILSGDSDRALIWARSYLAEENPSLFAWALLENGVAPPLAASDTPADTASNPTETLPIEPFLLAELGNRTNPSDFETAWRMTGEWRYAADAAILHLKAGSVASALEIVVGASIPLRAPLLAADVFRDAGDDARALSALRSASGADERQILPRMADALMSAGHYREAQSLYLDLVERMPLISHVPYINLGWMAASPEERLAYYNAAVTGFPGSWDAVEQRALAIAANDLPAAYESLTGYSGPQGDSRVSLLRLKLEPYLDQRGYEAAVWRLVGTPDVPEDALRFAAWYFAGRGQMDALDELLGGRDVESSWYHTYSGLASAYAGEWTKAAQSFDAAYLSNPSWRTSLNRALSMIASGSPGSGAEALADAGAATRLLGPPADSSPLFVAVARAAADTTIAYDAVTTALELDPTNTEALLIRNQLESGSGY